MRRPKRSTRRSRRRCPRSGRSTNGSRLGPRFDVPCPSDTSTVAARRTHDPFAWPATVAPGALERPRSIAVGREVAWGVTAEQNRSSTSLDGLLIAEFLHRGSDFLRRSAAESPKRLLCSPGATLAARATGSPYRPNRRLDADTSGSRAGSRCVGTPASTRRRSGTRCRRSATEGSPRAGSRPTFG